MTGTHFDLDDARSDRAAELREQRAAARAHQNGRPASLPATPDVDDQPFTPVDDLPKRRGGSSSVPSARQALIDYCLAHPGQWVRYTPRPDQDKVKPHSLMTMQNKQQGGLVAGIEVKVRGGVAYVRYQPEAGDQS